MWPVIIVLAAWYLLSHKVEKKIAPGSTTLGPTPNTKRTGTVLGQKEPFRGPPLFQSGADVGQVTGANGMLDVGEDVGHGHAHAWNGRSWH
jgi:hypothetical protein